MKAFIEKSQIQFNSRVARTEDLSYNTTNKEIPYIFAKTVLTPGLHMWSFGLHPTNSEQPSGSCNASALQSSDLILTINTKDIPPDNALTLEFLYFVVCYNRLTITGGMGGLAYA